MELEELPATLARRNWWILGLLLLLSLPFRAWSVTAGILVGGLLAILSFGWLQRSLKRLLATPGQGARGRYQFGYLLRLLVMAFAIGLLVAVVKINPVGLVIGLSVVVVNLLWFTLQRVLK